MIEFPYGIADFRTIRQDGMLYVDRTAYIHTVERLGRPLVYLRPRRFGKSLWLQTLANYYDLLRADEFEELFGDLAIGADPTPRRNRYFVLQWNFSQVRASGDVAEISRRLDEHVRGQIRAFAEDYKDHLPRPVETEGDSETVLIDLLAAIRRTPYKLYLLIDEYDNFVNDIMVRDPKLYQALFEADPAADGPYKALFKSVKASMEGRGLERVFVTGVSPIALNDLTSGFNNAKNVSLKPQMATLCGFRGHEVRELLERVADERGLSTAAVEEAADTMRTWYNGYRFTDFPPETEGQADDDLVYNPTNVLYYLEELYEHRAPPSKLHDTNLRTDRGKLAFVAGTYAGAGVIEQLTEGDGSIEVSRLEDTFSLEELLTRLGEDRQLVASFLYYMGLLTLEVPGIRPRLKVPNLVIRKLLLDRLHGPLSAGASGDTPGDVLRRPLRV